MNTIRNAIFKLERISKYYNVQGNLGKKHTYNLIINELRELYKSQPNDFTDQDIAEINKLKIIIKNRSNHYIKNCYFKINNESNNIFLYVSTPIGDYSFINNKMLNNKLENDEIQIKINQQHEILYIFDRIKKIYLYPSINQKIIRYKEGNIYRYKHVYFNCQYNYIYTQSYEDIEAVQVNFMDSQEFMIFKFDDVFIKYDGECYEDGLRTFKITDKKGKYIFYLHVIYDNLIDKSEKTFIKRLKEKAIKKDYEKNAFINHNYKYVIKEKLMNIAKNGYKDNDNNLVKLKQYIFYYLDEYLDDKNVLSDVPPEFRIEHMYEYICSAIDEIVVCKTEDVLNDNLKMIYSFIEDRDIPMDFGEGLNIW